MRTAMAFVALGLLWAACAAPLRLLRTVTSTPTFTPTLTQAPTLVPTPLPSSTPRPTASARPSPTIDPSVTLSPTPTFVFPTPSRTPTAISLRGCRLDWQSPGSGIVFTRDEQFTAGWKITNTGLETWTPGSVEFTYLGGAQLHRDPVVQLKASVPPGQSVILTADMRAPRNSTLYTTYWSLRQGDAFFCRVSLTIYVK
jgi:hypothetical protein